MGKGGETVLNEKVKTERAGMKDIFRDDKETVQLKLPKYINVILMRCLSNGKYKLSTSHLLTPNEPLSMRTMFHSIEFLSKEVQWKYSNNLGY